MLFDREFGGLINMFHPLPASLFFRTEQFVQSCPHETICHMCVTVTYLFRSIIFIYRLLLTKTCHSIKS